MKFLKIKNEIFSIYMYSSVLRGDCKIINKRL